VITNSNSLAVLIVGLGPHGSTVYLTGLKDLQKKYNLVLAGVVELASAKNAVLAILQEYGLAAETTFIPASPRTKGETYELDADLRKHLDRLVHERGVRAVVIATEPLSHKAYFEWALANNLHVLIDKPLTLPPYASIEVSQAERIESDYVELMDLFRKGRDRVTGRRLVIQCMLQRRFQDAYQDLRATIRQVFDATQCPVTSVTIVHNDGQWRFPEELLRESYHGFDEGIGKLAHTGYHFLDIVPWLIEDAQKPELPIDTLTVQCNLIRPKDLIFILPPQTIGRLFGNGHLRGATTPLSELAQQMARYGEVDAYVTIRFCHQDIVICHANLTLLHSGLSYRHWADTSADPYINKGRIKQETLLLYQGPFLAAQYHRYRATRGPGSEHRDFGGEHHNELNYIFNDKMLGFGDGPVVRKSFERKVSDRGVPGDKLRGLDNFFAAILHGSRASCEMTLEEHWGSVRLLASVYRAAALGIEGKPPIYSTRYSFEW
jgi:predicted dehydrogenase